MLELSSFYYYKIKSVKSLNPLDFEGVKNANDTLDVLSKGTRLVGAAI